MRRPLTGALPIEASGTNRDAWIQPSEPDHGLFWPQASIWYRWTAANSGPVAIETCASDFDTGLGVYTGSALHRLTVVATNDNGCGTRSRLRFDARAGVTYRIAVDGQFGATGTVRLRIRPANPPANDAFADSQPIAGTLPLTVTGSNVDASREDRETDFFLDAIASVWFRWTADATGPVTIDTCDSDFDAGVDVLTGSTFTGLTEARWIERGGCGGGAFGRVTLNVRAGVTYRLRVDGVDGPTMGSIALRISRPPANDDINHATPLTDNRASGITAGATKEPGEPEHGGDRGGASVWHSWTAPGSGSVEISACAARFDALLGVYTGGAVNRLSPVSVSQAGGGCPHGQGSRIRFDATAGQTYLIAVDGRGGDVGSFELLAR